MLGKERVSVTTTSSRSAATPSTSSRAGAGPRGGVDVHLPAAVPAPDDRGARRRASSRRSPPGPHGIQMASHRSSWSRPDRRRCPPTSRTPTRWPMLQAGLIFQTEITDGLRRVPRHLSYLVPDPSMPTRFTEAVRQLVPRHPIFRTSYHLTGFTEALQLVHPTPPCRCHRRPARDRRGGTGLLARDWARREQCAPVRLGASPGWCTLHIQVLADDLYRYSLSQHNSALDGWSIARSHTRCSAVLPVARRLPVTRAGDRQPPAELRRAGACALGRPWRVQFWPGCWTARSAPTYRARRRPRHRPIFQVVFHEVDLPTGLSDRVIALADRSPLPFKNVLLAAHVEGALARLGCRRRDHRLRAQRPPGGRGGDKGDGAVPQHAAVPGASGRRHVGGPDPAGLPARVWTCCRRGATPWRR